MARDFAWGTAAARRSPTSRSLAQDMDAIVVRPMPLDAIRVPARATWTSDVPLYPVLSEA